MTHVNVTLSQLGDLMSSPGTPAGTPANDVTDDVSAAWRDVWRGAVLGVVLAALCLLTIVGNVLVLHAVRTERRLQTVRRTGWKVGSGAGWRANR